MQLILFIWFIFTTLHVSDAVCVHHQEQYLQTVVAATGVCHRYGVAKFRVGFIGSVCYIPRFNRC